jgi:hypothetical protein
MESLDTPNRKDNNPDRSLEYIIWEVFPFFLTTSSLKERLDGVRVYFSTKVDE